MCFVDVRVILNCCFCCVVCDFFICVRCGLVVVGGRVFVRMCLYVVLIVLVFYVVFVFRRFLWFVDVCRFCDFVFPGGRSWLFEIVDGL